VRKLQKELIESEEHLPATIPELQKFILIGEGAISSYKAKLKTLDKVEIAEDVRKQTLQDGQKIGEAVLLATIRLGELLESLSGSTAGTTRILPDGVDKKLSYYSQLIKDNKEIVHQIVAKAIDKEDIATRHDVLKAIKEMKREAKIEAQKQEIQKGLEQPEGLFDIIVIDPPWEYGRKYDADGGHVASPYPEMNFESIESIELPAKENCILWFWTTHQFIWDAKELMDNWDFSYKAILVWNKARLGMGKWLRMQCEFCLLGIKGKPLWETKTIRDYIKENLIAHSVKPESFYKMIDNNFIGRKLDYFGRKPRDGWELYGAGQNSISE